MSLAEGEKFVTFGTFPYKKLHIRGTYVVVYYSRMRLRQIQQAKVRGKRVLVRVDYNVALEKNGQLRDLTRLKETLPTLRWLLNHGAKIILVSHRGRPHGRDKKLSLKPVVAPLQRLLKRKIVFIDAPIFSQAFLRALDHTKPTEVVLVENIRFEAGEEDDSPALAKRLAGIADLAVNDAFADSHRAHASIVGVAQYLKMYAGLLVQKEVATLLSLLTKPARPYVAIIGGAKISTKLHLIKKLLHQADMVLLGGALANTLLQAEGIAIGSSLVEPSMVKIAAGLTSTNHKLKIPCDVVVATKKRAYAATRTTAVGNIKPNESILDIGPDTVDLFGRVLKQAKTIVWNGPMGVYEIPPFDRATVKIAQLIAAKKSTSIAGGGETIDAIHRAGVSAKFSFLSTGGGAMLEFLEGKTLPGVAAVTVRR